MDLDKSYHQDYPFEMDGKFSTYQTYFLDSHDPTYNGNYEQLGESQFWQNSTIEYPPPHSTTTESGSEGYSFDSGSTPCALPSTTSSPYALPCHDFHDLGISGSGIDLTDEEIWEWLQSNPLDSIPPYNPSLFENQDTTQACLVSQMERPLLPKPEAPASIQAVNSPISVEVAKLEPRRRRRKNPADLRKNRRKQEKPEKCLACGKGHADTRALERHIVSNHRDEAIQLGLDVSKVDCPYCAQTFDRIRKDRLTRHVKTQHPDLYQYQFQFN
ncbi:unnamed protein product [Clonostachys rosea f. rosea IK726]|uniref:Uncharacterized protein n=1 Tax=Clonostachys rosea f. rosea IK726 TaxID=1349383 RepID=A0ACA9TJQ4_BIOOC|nr:unnamed protein product [Clonostachys rosea f. rosea IK726]